MKFLLLEDHPIFRLGVRQLIGQRWPDARIEEAGTLAEALKVVRESAVDVVLADLNLPDSDGLEAVSQLRRASSATKILVLSLNAETAYARRAMQLGASGYLAKDRAAAELITAVEAIAAGRRYITLAVAEQMADLLSGEQTAEPHTGLSSQEYRVMIQLAEGMRIADIAALMKLSPKTISTYRTRILDKLGLKSNAELARYCLTHRLLDASMPD